MPGKDTELMERLRDGDMDAMTELVEMYQGELVGYFYHHCWDQAAAEDMAQNVFIKVFKARERYQVRARVRTYLYRIAHNVWVDHLRRKKNLVSLDAEVGGDGTALKNLIAAEQEDVMGDDRSAQIRRRVKEAVAELPQGQQDVFILANNHEMKYAEISKVLGIPEGTVKSRMHGAVRTLRGKLKDLVDS